MAITSIPTLLALLSVFLLGSAVADTRKFLIYKPGVDGFGTLYQDLITMDLGSSYDLVDATTFCSMTVAQFSAYRAVVFADPRCQIDSTSFLPTCNLNALHSANTGNMIIHGTDENYHWSIGVVGAKNLARAGLSFAGAHPTQTGIYLSFSCYYDFVDFPQPTTFLGPWQTHGTFDIIGFIELEDCNAVHIVSANPTALAVLADSDLAPWHCSVHEAFTSFSTDFVPFAIETLSSAFSTFPGAMAFPDGSFGIPYILAKEVKQAVTLSNSKPNRNYHGQLCHGVTASAFTTVHHGYVTSPQNWELFSFAGLAGQAVTISVRRITPSMDPIMQLWSPTGALLLTQDDDACPCGSCCGGPFGDPQLNSYVLPESGDFMVAIADYSSSAPATGPLAFSVSLVGTTPCCTNAGWRCLSSHTYGYCPAGGSISPNNIQTCQTGLVCCPSVNDVYCVRPDECPYDTPQISCGEQGVQKCLTGNTYTTCAVSIQVTGLFFGPSQACQSGLVCCNSSDGKHIYCVRPGETC